MIDWNIIFNNYLIILVFIICSICIFRYIKRRKEIQNQVKRVIIANQPWYRVKDDYFETIIKDGVISYKKRKGEHRK